MAVRSVALEFLLQSSQSEAIEAVNDIIRFEDKQAELRVAAIGGVGPRRIEGTGVIETVDALVHALGDDTLRIRRLAAEALGDIGDASAIEALLNALSQQDLDSKTRSAIVSALGKFQASPAHSSRVMYVLVKVMEAKSHDEKVRANAARNLGGFRQEESITALQMAAQSEDELQAVRAAAISALANLAYLAGDGKAKVVGSEAFSRLKPSGSYILSPSMHGPDWPEVEESFKRYKHYLGSISDQLPPGAREYALGDNHNWGGCESPHDSWLEELRMEVRSTPSTDDLPQDQALDIHVRFLGTCGNGYIDFHYRNVHDYLLTNGGDWMYDEVRLGGEGRVVHEIRFLADSHWLIECEDFTYEWKPFDEKSSNK